LEHVAFVEADLCRSLLNPFMMAELAEFDRSLRMNPEGGELAKPEDLGCLLFWWQQAEEEASGFTE
jgi:hypothetical protein